MAPEPQKHWPSQNSRCQSVPSPTLNGDSVVISGMSGDYPMSAGIDNFSKILYSKTNPVNYTDMGRKQKHPEVSEYIGKVPDLDRFDSQFFMVHHHLAEFMAPMARKVLEHSFQAIYDAGLSPKHLSKIKVGVYIAATFSENEVRGIINKSRISGYNITGVSKSMFANRISYWLNAKGPSMTIDNGCNGSIVALEEAFNAINNGVIDAAIVGGTFLGLSPHYLVHYNRCIRISPDDQTKSFDQNANGCTQSEAVSVLFIQKAKDAKRAYAEVVNVKSEFISTLCGETGQSFGFVRDPDSSAAFLNDFYSVARVSPNEVEYVEACGSATPEADKAELLSIEKVFCNDRPRPLHVGSVMSNVGFSDAASGLTAVTKVLLGYHHSLIASNLHCETPRQDVPAIKDGRMCIVTDHKPFTGTYAAVNCLSYTGVNSHVLLRRFTKQKDLNRYQTSFPRLLTVSARQEAFLKDVFETLKSHPIDAEQLALLQNIHSLNISGHLGRGYIILDTDKEERTVCLSECTAHSDETSRPLWFVYSGMGSQWAGMGAQLMRIPIFAAAIERCNKVLESEGIDIMHIITTPDKTIFDNVLNAFVGIAAIQIGLTDVLRALKLYPDKMIGHSVGELGCAYADGCLTAEEMILSAYGRGKASNEISLIRGAMAAVGIGYQKLSTLCPQSIEIACHNSSSSCTISGPEESVRGFVAMLTAKGVFAREVPSANIAYHSSYISEAGPYLLEYLSKIIENPKPRSERWLSTSVPQARWDEPAAKYCSAEYLTNNLLSPVLFEETCSLIPSNAVLVEIAPHGLLQAILKRALPDSCTNIPLTQRGHKDNAQFLLEAIGKLYIEGYYPQVQEIYPKIEFPVSIGTPHLGSLVKWIHSESWVCQAVEYYSVKSASSYAMSLSVHDLEHNYLSGHIVQGNNLFPFAGALVAVWDTLAMTLCSPKKKLSVQFSDVHFYSQPILHDLKPLNLDVFIHRGNGHFEVLSGNSKVAFGYVSMLLESILYDTDQSSDDYNIGSDEIYKHFDSRGYSYRDDFRSIDSLDKSLTKAEIVWNNNWVTFIDGLLQLNTLRCSYNGVSQPSQIRDLTIDIDKHAAILEENLRCEKRTINAKIDEACDSTRCGGVLLRNLKLQNSPPSSAEVSFELSTLTSANINDFVTPQINEVDDNKVSLQIGNIGDFETLHWEEKPDTAVKEGGIKVQVEYAGINVSDVNRAFGTIPYEESEKYFGMDFSGVTMHGERVMGLVSNGAASTMVSARSELLWPVPTHWTLEEAATVPLAYTQAFFYLCIRSRLQRGSTVLIHGGAGALGQAAISIALAYHCTVFTTVSDNNKKKFLLKLFPELNEDHIGNSRTDAFVDMILSATHGQRCDVVLSCVRDDLKYVSMKCAGSFSFTTDVSHCIPDKDKSFGMHNLTDERSYIAADFYSVINSEKMELKKFQVLIAEGIANGAVRPLTCVTFAPHEATRAFRLLAASRHRGRALLRLKDELATPPLLRITCTSRSTHVIIWDGNSFGLELADRLIARGVKNLRILCLKPTPQLLLKQRLWQGVGVDVELLSNENIEDNAVSELLNKLTLHAPIEGMYISVTGEVLDSHYASKIEKVIEDLDKTSRKLQLILKYFVIISTKSNLGQDLCRSRAEDGLPATALYLPAVQKVNNSLNYKSSWNRSAVDATERALCSKNTVLFAQLYTVDQPSLKKIIPSLAVSGDNDVTLKDLRLEDYLPSILSFLKDVCHISIDNDDVLMLTKRQILETEKETMECILKDEKGLGVFFSLQGHDELEATVDLISLNTAAINIDTLVGGVDSSKSNLFIIPGLEGHHERFRVLCERLKLPAMVLQPGLDRPRETPQQLAHRYSKIVLEQFKLKKNFYLLGYEFGNDVALELAAILEDHDLTGIVYCIGDGPDEMKALLESELISYPSETDLQEGLVRHIYSLMTKDSSKALESALRGYTSWQERADACVRLLLGRAPQTAQYIRALLEAAYARIDTARCVTPAPRTLRSRLVLMRARRERQHGGTCSLQRYSQQPLIIEDLDVAMTHIAADCRVPVIVNKYLGSDLLETYENSNLCNSYVMFS